MERGSEVIFFASPLDSDASSLRLDGSEWTLPGGAHEVLICLIRLRLTLGGFACLYPYAEDRIGELLHLGL